MTVNELIQQLQAIADSGGGDHKVMLHDADYEGLESVEKIEGFDRLVYGRYSGTFEKVVLINPVL